MHIFYIYLSGKLSWHIFLNFIYTDVFWRVLVTDVDECSQSDPVCTEENQKCINTHGSYMCICSGGYEEKDGKCVHTVQPGWFYKLYLLWISWI